MSTMDGSLEYFALIGDVVSSRTASDRTLIQERLIRSVQSINERFSLAAPLAFSAGDAVEALLVRPQIVVPIVRELCDAIFPERLVFGLGRGRISTALYENVALIDGECFHYARAALEEMNRDQWLVSRGLGARNDRVLTALFTLMHALRRGWTQKQFDYVVLARKMNQKEVAEKVGVDPSTVSVSLRAASYPAVMAAEEAIFEWLEQFDASRATNLR